MTTYLSQDGLDNLVLEFQDRKTTKRKEISERILAAKELGDLSENFEYHDAKEQQGLNEARIMQLDQMIKDVVIVEQKRGEDSIGIGTTFTADINGTEKEFEIVGASETDPLSGKISNESPLGQAFLGKSIGDEVEVFAPSGKIIYKVKSIK
ncbi:MAG: transcription elongation factor GreA [Patescibacteria group bacterium]